MIATTYARLGALAFTLALAVPHVAEAKCAWILWGQTFQMINGKLVMIEWAPRSGYETRAECMKEILSDWKGEWLCLPDTMDPREPKGGGR